MSDYTNLSTSLAWDEDFPKGYGHTSIAFLKRCPGYEDAKAGDLNAAGFVVSRCVKENRLRQLREQYPAAVLLPVLGQNKLPLALAQEIGLPIWPNVRFLKIVTRKLLCAMQRLLHKPVFTGFIQRDSHYILVDDIVTQGGTIAALREFVMIRGGKVVAVVALAYAIGSHAIAPTRWHMVRLFLKFGVSLLQLLQIFGIAVTFQALTDAQARYLLRFASCQNIERRLIRLPAQLPTLGGVAI